MRLARPTKLRHWIALALAVAMLVILVLVSGLFTWSPLNCRHEEVDTNSGRIRRTHLLLYVQVAEQVEETWLSRAVSQPLGPPDWRRVNTFSPAVRHSPQYAYHGAIAQIRVLEQTEQIVRFEPPARRKVAEQVLRLWQKGTYFPADDYIQQVSEAALSLREKGASVVKSSDVPQ